MIAAAGPNKVNAVESWLRQAYRGGDNISALYLGYLITGDPSIEGNPLELFLDALEKGVPPADYAAVNYISRNNIDIQPRINDIVRVNDQIAVQTKKIITSWHSAGLLSLSILSIPAAMEGYGPAIVSVVSRLGDSLSSKKNRESKESKRIAEFWAQKAMTHDAWFTINRLGTHVRFAMNKLYQIMYGEPENYRVTLYVDFVPRYGD
jgi:hypothetical protein